MTDALAIANLKARYCAAADLSASDQAGARALFDGIFTDDFVGDYGFPLNGPQAIIDFMSTAIAANSEWMVHMLHSPSIEVSGDRATGAWTVMGHMKRREGGQIDVILGRYSDEFVRTAAGWQIAKIRFERVG
jgi:SnoaL-like domain